MLVSFDHENRKVQLLLNGGDVLETLQEKGERTNPNHPTLWRPEYGSYMIEGTPGQPYGGTMSEFNTVEANMRKRRKEATSVLGERQALCTITSFPRSAPPSAWSSRNSRLESTPWALPGTVLTPIRSPHCWTAEHCHLKSSL